MMKSNTEAMRANLEQLISTIKDKLIVYGPADLYENELNKLEDAINSKLTLPRNSFSLKEEKHRLVKLIMGLIDQINKDITSVEAEMQGVFNYSEYESKRVDEVAFKQTIKKDLTVMLELVVSTRP